MSTSTTCGPGASASSSGALGFLASTSRTADESSMGFGSPSRPCLFDNGKAGDADLRVGSISMSNLEPRLCVLLRWRSSLSFSEINDSMGRREGTHASGKDEDHDISQDFNPYEHGHQVFMY